MKVLRQRLKVNAKTKPATLAAAAALARDSSLDEAKLFDVHKVARGRAQVHAKALAARIVRESLLDPASASSSAWLFLRALCSPLHTGNWIKANAPGLLEVEADPLVVC
jgi:hypothetical protein